MSIPQDTVQYAVTAFVRVAFSDLVSGASAKLIELPQNATVVDFKLVVDTAFNSATSDAVDIGDASDPDRYAAAANLQVAGLVANPGTADDLSESTSADVAINALLTSVGAAATAGSFRALITYVVDGRSHENRG